MELKPEPSRSAVLATGIIDGMPECALACAADGAVPANARSRREATAAPAERLAQTTHRQRWPTRIRGIAGAPAPCRRCLNRADNWAAPDSLAAD
jgi:hypothetical protein